MLKNELLMFVSKYFTNIDQTLYEKRGSHFSQSAFKHWQERIFESSNVKNI